MKRIKPTDIKHVNVVESDEIVERNDEVNEVKDGDDDGHVNLHLLDMGCGKGYLTMAAHDFLSNEFNVGSANDIVMDDDDDDCIKQVLTLGIDVRDHLIKEANLINSANLGYGSTMKFETMSIDQYLNLNRQSNSEQRKEESNRQK
jgi:hypothetical protein